jgi:hypothetical protein
MPLRILVVDDSVVTRSLIQEFAECFGHQVVGEAAFFSQVSGAWASVDPLPTLSPGTFKLKEPKPPKARHPGEGFEAKFFVELTLPREGTMVTAEGRWVNAYRDDSGYGQSDTLLSREVVFLSWNATTGTFSVSR